MNLIDYLGPKRAEPLRRLAAIVGATDDTAFKAWAAWQELAGMDDTQRDAAVALFIGLEEIKRKSENRKPLFTVPVR